MTKIVVGSGAFILDATTYNVIKNQGHHYEAKWSTVDPNTMFYISGNQFRKLNVTTGADVVLRTFPEGDIDMGPWEGNISVGDRYVVLTVGTLAILYDILNDSVLAKRDVNSDAAGSVDWISVSQSGNYIVAIGPAVSAFGVLVYDRANFGNTGIAPRKIDDTGRHADLGYDASGAEVYVADCPMEQIRLDNGVRRNLLPGTAYFWQCGHTSTRNHNLPGWSLYGDGVQVYAIKLDGSGTVRRFAHTRSTQSDYQAEARAVISPDGSKVIWNSDWGDSSAPVYAYVAEMPGGATPPPPPPSPLSVTVSLPATTFTANQDGSPVYTTVTATPSRAVTKVDLSRDAFPPFLTDNTSPYKFTWCVTCFNANEPLPRTTTLHAIATASDGAVATGDKVVTVNPYGTPNNGVPSANLALNGPVAVSSTESTATAASYAVDGNAATRWSSTYSDPQWIRVDLGSQRQINRVVLRWEAAYGRSYRLQVSSDNVNWTDIYTTTTGDGNIDDLTVSGTGRYLRMHGTVRGTTYGYSLWEMEVYGSDASSPLSISMNVACAPNCPLNGTTTAVNVTVLSGTPTSMEFSRDGLPVFLTCPGGSQCYPSPSWGFDWCVSSSCWGGVSGSHTLNVTARNAAGQTATAAVTMNVSDGLLPPGRLRITP